MSDRGTRCRFRREKLLLALIAAAALANLYPLNTQDVTRLALSQSIARRGALDVDPFHRLMLDRSFRAGHWYSDKPPGMSVVAIPVEEALHGIDVLRGADPDLHVWLRKGQLWLLRVSTSGLALLALCLLAGRAAEVVVAGTGAATAVTLGVGTMAGPLGPTMLAHVPAAALAFGAFVLAWRRPALLAAAGALAGAAVLFEYQAALAGVVLLAYAAARRGLSGAVEFVAGAIPAAALLAAYNAVAFGSPFHFSYRYVANKFAAQQHSGFFGIGMPHLESVRIALVGNRGLLTLSPVLVAALVGLVLLWRGPLRRETATCLAIVAAFLLVDWGYFDPLGGDSPGPRFFVVALPFLTFGLPAAFRRAPRVTAALAAASVVLTTWDSFTWQGVVRFMGTPETIWSRLGAPNAAGVALVALAAAAAAIVAYLPFLRGEATA